LLIALATAAAAQQANTRAARILGMFDINGQGGPDQAVDSDADGLPDTWEVGGLDAENTDVPFPAPEAIVPGTPPTPIFNRRPVRTSATSRDTDGDGLSDFIEVFGLKFIDDNGNGVLDDASVRDAADNVLFNADGSPQRATDATGFDVGDWFDFNGDGLPSPGEFPARNALVGGDLERFDFDGFVFTDPTNPDTDGDGVADGADNDPLVNPRSFGQDRAFFSSGGGSLANDQDFDNDGLGNGLDLGNDVDGEIDNPTDLLRVIEIFRPDLLGGSVVRVPEGLIEDLLGADWNGDGLFRLTDILEPHFGVVAEPTLGAGAIDLFRIEDPDDPTSTIPLGFATTLFPSGFSRTTYYTFARRGSGGVNAPLPYQELLVPAGRADNVFLPDPRIWTVLYAWRMPGFDVDGNGFIGIDGASFSGDIDVNGVTVTGEQRRTQDNVPSSELPTSGTQSLLDGQIDVTLPAFCTASSFTLISLALVGAAWTRPTSRRRR
jgi:hypothetical protein